MVSVNYVSTRGSAPELGFCDTVLTGLARDGGLYLPKEWPQLAPEAIRGMAGQSYCDVARQVITPFVAGEIPDDELSAMIKAAYATFHHPAVAPLVQLDTNHWLLELFHGPTLAFKDVAMQLLARIMDHALAQRGDRATIVGATSGDTGSAAIEAFKGRENTDIFILFPHGKVSPVQQKQMTTVADANVHTLAIKGDFDDCQAMVKAMFNHHAFRDEYRLSGVNSINWGRIMAQVVYYFTAAAAIGAPERAVSFTVPTGNFGDIFAAYVARQMGLPIEKLVIATNQNDILARTLASGRYEVTSTAPSISPSMDIQVSSNFERLLFEACGRDAEMINSQMSGLSQSGAFELDPATRTRIADLFAAGSCLEDETRKQIAATLEATGYLSDPHTAVGLHVAADHLDATTPMITLATAHPAKFPQAVEEATGVHPQLPARMGDMMAREERFVTLPNDVAEVETYIKTHARINVA